MSHSGVYRILLIEDNPGDAMLVRSSLAEEGPTHFEMIHVERLGDALQQVAENRFDLEDSPVTSRGRLVLGDSDRLPNAAGRRLRSD